MEEAANLIGGSLAAAVSGGTIVIENPATEELIGTVPGSSAVDVDAAVAAARGAAREWAARPAAERAEIVGRALEMLLGQPDLTDLAVADTGHPLRLSQAYHVYGPAQWGGELVGHALAFAVQNGRRTGVPDTSEVRHMPFGVVGVLTPFNAPLALTVWKAVPALVLGNTVVAKPSEVAPLLVSRFYGALTEAGVPAGVVNVVHGGREPAERLVAHPDVDRITFTGSTSVGALIGAAAAANLTPTVLELGGKSPAIILDDADLELAARAVAASAFGLSGQTCAATTRVLVGRAELDEVVERLASLAERLTIGDPRDVTTDIGPLANANQLARVTALVTTAVDEDAKVVTGGERTDVGGRGHYYRPTVLRGVDNDSTIARTEVFGPVVSVIGCDSPEHAVQLANDNPYGLAGAVFGSDLDRCRAVATQVQAGTVWINDVNALLTTAPFGGMKDSGHGRELGIEGVAEFVQPQHLYTAPDTDLSTRMYALVGSSW